MTRRHQANGDAGLILADALFALIIVVLAGLWLFGAYQSALELSEVGQQGHAALDDLADMMERIKTTPFSQLATDFPNGAVNGVVGSGADKYGTIIGGYRLTGQQIVVSHLPSTAADPRELQVQVNWTNRGRLYQRRLSTMRTSKGS